jgi:hypothetical protein
LLVGGDLIGVKYRVVSLGGIQRDQLQQTYWDAVPVGVDLAGRIRNRAGFKKAEPALAGTIARLAIPAGKDPRRRGQQILEWFEEVLALDVPVITPGTASTTGNRGEALHLAIVINRRCE